MSPLWVKIRFICKFLIIKPKQTSNPYNFCKRASNKTYFGAWEIPSMSESKLLQADSFQNSIIRFQMEASNFSSTQNRSGCVISTKPDAFSRVLIFWNNFFLECRGHPISASTSAGWTWTRAWDAPAVQILSMLLMSTPHWWGKGIFFWIFLIPMKAHKIRSLYSPNFNHLEPIF